MYNETSGNPIDRIEQHILKISNLLVRSDSCGQIRNFHVSQTKHFSQYGLHCLNQIKDKHLVDEHGVNSYAMIPNPSWPASILLYFPCSVSAHTNEWSLHYVKEMRSDTKNVCNHVSWERAKMEKNAITAKYMLQGSTYFHAHTPWQVGGI